MPSAALLAVALLCIVVAPAIRAEVYLQGNFVELGIADAGSFGTFATAPPPGYHGNIYCSEVDGSFCMGFVADYGKDGWTVGSPPFAGDYFLPGAPEEGWAVEYTSPSGTTTCNNFGAMGQQDAPTISLKDTSSGSLNSAVWTGYCAGSTDTVSNLTVTQTYSFHDTDLYFKSTVTLTNTGTVTLTDVYYMRNVDPDQEEPWTGDFSTINYVPDSVNATSDLVLVTAVGPVYGFFLGIGTASVYAVGSVGGFSNRDPGYVYNNPGSGDLSEAEDVAITLAYKFPVLLAPGNSLTFDFIHCLSAGALNSVLNNLDAVTIVAPSGTISGSSVSFLASVDSDASHPTSVVFLINGVVIATKSAAANGAYNTSFSSLGYVDGTISLSVNAHFADGTVSTATASVVVVNHGPAVVFVNPIANSNNTGSSVLATVVSSASAATIPISVTFTRQVAGYADLALGTVTSAPFTVSVPFTDLRTARINVTVVAVATNSAGKNATTTIQFWFVCSSTVNNYGTAACGTSYLINRKFPGYAITATSLISGATIIADVYNATSGPTALQSWSYDPTLGVIYLASNHNVIIGGGPVLAKISSSITSITWDFKAALAIYAGTVIKPNTFTYESQSAGWYSFRNKQVTNKVFAAPYTNTTNQVWGETYVNNAFVQHFAFQTFQCSC